MQTCFMVMMATLYKYYVAYSVILPLLSAPGASQFDTAGAGKVPYFRNFSQSLNVNLTDADTLGGGGA